MLIIIPLLALAWHYYTSADSSLNHTSANIMPNAGLDELDGNNRPLGWRFTPANGGVSISSQPGYQSPHQLVITSRGSSTTSSTLASPEVGVDQGRTYLYKGFYSATLPFDLIMESTLVDGTKHLDIIRQYDASTQWATLSHTFTVQPNIRSVAFVLRFSKAGELHIDNTYLEPNPINIMPPTALATGANLLPAPTNQPDSTWAPYSDGSLHMTTATIDEPTPYLHLTVDDYQNGSATWQPALIQIHGNQAFQTSLDYKSSTPAEIVAQYVDASGHYTFYSVATLQPTNEWTTYTSTIEAPKDAVSMTISLVARANGTIDSRNYSLIDITKPGTPAWRRPLLSLTFDDGWESAYLSAVPLLARYNYAATFYLTPSALDTQSFMSSDDVNRLAKSGHELASHGYGHMDFTTIDTPQLSMQLSRAADYFREVHQMPKVNFSVPFGGTDSQVEYVARQYYTSLRTTEDGINTRQNLNRYHLLVLYIGKNTPPDKLQSLINDTQALNGWLILVYHRVDTNTQGEPVVSPEQFQAHMEAIKKSGITVEPVNAALQEVGAQ